MKHVHHELIKQWADGAEIQSSHDGIEWTDAPSPMWLEERLYRVKPTRIVRYGWISMLNDETMKASTIWFDEPQDTTNVKITFLGDKLIDIRPY